MVLKISKMDKVSLVSDAIAYIHEFRNSAAAAHARGESLAVVVKAMHDEVVPQRQSRC